MLRRLIEQIKKYLTQTVAFHVRPWLVKTYDNVRAFAGSYYMKQLKTKMQPHKFVRLRKRYLFTRSNRLRLRYMIGSAACFMVVLASLGTSSSSWALRWEDSARFETRIAAIESEQQKVEELAALVEEPMPVYEEDSLPHTSFEDGYDQTVAETPVPDVASLDVPETVDDELTEMIKTKVSTGIRHASVAIKKSEKPFKAELEIGKGETVAGVLSDAGVPASEAYQVIQAMSEHFDLRKVRPGQTINVHYAPGENEDDRLFSELVMKIDPQKEVKVFKEDDQFAAEVIEKALVERSNAGHTEIKTSLYGSAARAGIPSQVIAEVIRIYSWNVDFQRDIRQGDRIEVMYNITETEDGDFVRYGDIVYANLHIRGKDMPIYRYEMSNGRVDYFQPNGQSIRKTLMATPIDGARISSGFGMRRHPVLGYNKMHKGMDFAAPTGTPIYAAGDGTVDFAGRHGGYGNYIRIRHNGTLKTAYAHMHKFAKGMKKGKTVKQGDVIGYVGTTGRSTGPHLHYEVLVNGKQKNPRGVDLPTGEILKADNLERFKKHISGIHQQYVSLTDNMEVAVMGRSEVQSSNKIR